MLGRLFACALSLFAIAVHAEVGPPVTRPADEVLEEPRFDGAATRILPEIATSEPQAAALSAGVSTYVRSYRFLGNAAIATRELEELAGPFAERTVNAIELETLRQTVSALYFSRGYVSSGAFFPDQDVQDQVVSMQIVEGRLTDIELTGNDSLPSSYILRRVGDSDAPLNISDLEDRLRYLQQDPRINRITAELKPGDRPAASRLLLDVMEAKPWRLYFGLDNERSPSIGETRASAYFTHYNVSGRADRLDVEVGAMEGLTDIRLNYAVPFGRANQVSIGYDYADSEVIEDPFDDLDITGETETFALGVSRQLTAKPHTALVASLFLERRQSSNELLGQPFSFTQGADDGESTVTVVRASMDGSWRDQRNALGLRLSVSLGFDAFGATINDSPIEDGQFSSVLLQGVWARRFLNSGWEVIARADAQFTDDALLPLEQFSLGGDYSVRGYRHSQFVRDQGFATSVELRVPLVTDLEGRPSLQLLVFVDYGEASNTARGSRSFVRLTGAGLGVRWSLSNKYFGHLVWSADLESVPDPQDRSLQDRGIHFRFEYRPFGD